MDEKRRNKEQEVQLLLNSSSPEEMLLKVLTLNCWGLRFVSRHRQSRIKAIAQHLRDQNYDVVFLQELWCQADFEHIREVTGYKFSYYYKTSSIAGTSGLAIFAKWAPDTLHFEPFTVNGSPFSPHHGDWFAGKGVAYARIDLQGLRLHLFCTHLHAQYDDNEKINDMYAIHRLCQAYQLGKFINLVAASAADVKHGKDLIVLAGDLNTSPGEPPFKLLMSMTGLIDCCMHRYSHDVRMTLRGIENIEVDEDLITCGHHSNTFTATATQKKTVEKNNSDKVLKPSGKRIDFVLYKMAQESNTVKSGVSLSEFSHSGLISGTKLQNEGKDPQSGLSFSDHQPVTVQLLVKLGKHELRLDDVFDRENGECTGIPMKLPLQALMNYKNGTFNEDMNFKNGHNVKNCRKVSNTDNFHDFSSGDLGIEDVESKILSSNSVVERPDSHFKNPILDMLPGRRSSSMTETKTVSKVTFNTDESNCLATKSIPEPCWGQLEECHSLLKTYLDDNRASKQRAQLLVIFLIVVTMCVTLATGHFMDWSSATLFHLLSGSMIVGFIFCFLVEFANRLEITAIKGIIEELSCLLEFAAKKRI